MISIHSSNSDGESFNKFLERVMTTYKLSTQALSKMSNSSEDMILDLLNGTVDETKYSQVVILEFQQFIVLLSVGFESVQSNERVQGVIEHLIHNLNFSVDSLALFSKLETQDIYHFLENPDSISFEKRYKLATTTLFLHYISKP
ncbi:HTH domain-containing protein [Paenibacillus massiliensis]|uniref:HTH domain-containing protein n=1 Tax=Paenibacillus massiliensis TaxID=225917 RepID=UPI00048BACD1|nr:HTH domain-containing protein [Paenibacillus massiliensis]